METQDLLSFKKKHIFPEREFHFIEIMAKYPSHGFSALYISLFYRYHAACRSFIITDAIHFAVERAFLTENGC